MSKTGNTSQPFLRWAGGKRWLLKHIDIFLPASINNYHEPFLGGGSIFWHLKNLNKIKGKSFLSDVNDDLINTYKQLRLHTDALIRVLESYENKKDFYYSLRAEEPESAIEKAARFIYLNAASFNGIYRVNKEGKYNVPYGSRNQAKLFDFSNIKLCSKFLDNTVDLVSADFEYVKENLQKNDLVFLDPPYTVAHENNGFIQYNQHIFSWEDQERLVELLKYISKRKAFFILTNAAHQSIDELFGVIGTPKVLQRASLIGGKGAMREIVNEYIFTNTILRA